MRNGQKTKGDFSELGKRFPTCRWQALMLLIVEVVSLWTRVGIVTSVPWEHDGIFLQISNLEDRKSKAGHAMSARGWTWDLSNFCALILFDNKTSIWWLQVAEFFLSLFIFSKFRFEQVKSLRILANDRLPDTKQATGRFGIEKQSGIA